MQLRSSVVGQVNEAEAEVEEARAQAEQEKQERRAHMQTLLAEKADLETALQHQQQAAKQLQVCATMLHQWVQRMPQYQSMTCMRTTAWRNLLLGLNSD